MCAPVQTRALCASRLMNSSGAARCARTTRTRSQASTRLLHDRPSDSNAFLLVHRSQQRDVQVRGIRRSPNVAPDIQIGQGDDAVGGSIVDTFCEWDTRVSQLVTMCLFPMDPDANGPVPVPPLQPHHLCRRLHQRQGGLSSSVRCHFTIPAVRSCICFGNGLSVCNPGTQMATQIVGALMALEAVDETEDIRLYINSPGEAGMLQVTQMAPQLLLLVLPWWWRWGGRGGWWRQGYEEAALRQGCRGGQLSRRGQRRQHLCWMLAQQAAAAGAVQERSRLGARRSCRCWLWSAAGRHGQVAGGERVRTGGRRPLCRRRPHFCMPARSEAVGRFRLD